MVTPNNLVSSLDYLSFCLDNTFIVIDDIPQPLMDYGVIIAKQLPEVVRSFRSADAVRLIAMEYLDNTQVASSVSKLTEAMKRALKYALFLDISTGIYIEVSGTSDQALRRVIDEQFNNAGDGIITSQLYTGLLGIPDPDVTMWPLMAECISTVKSLSNPTLLHQLVRGMTYISGRKDAAGVLSDLATSIGFDAIELSSNRFSFHKYDAAAYSIYCASCKMLNLEPMVSSQETFSRAIRELSTRRKVNAREFS